LLSKYLKIESYRNIILPVVFYVCETWSLTLREEHRLRVFENRVLTRRRMRGKRGCKNCTIKSFKICIPNWSVHEITGARSTYGENRNAYHVLVGKREGKPPG
jgi:hypothetical protein